MKMMIVSFKALVTNQSHTACCYRAHEKAKKRSYEQSVLEVEKVTATPTLQAWVAHLVR